MSEQISIKVIIIHCFSSGDYEYQYVKECCDISSNKKVSNKKLANVKSGSETGPKKVISVHKEDFDVFQALDMDSFAIKSKLGIIHNGKYDGTAISDSIFSQEVPTGYGLSHGLLIQEIVDRLSKGDIDPPISGSDALPAVELVHALYRSVETNNWVYLDDRPLSLRLGQ